MYIIIGVMPARACGLLWNMSESTSSHVPWIIQIVQANFKKLLDPPSDFQPLPLVSSSLLAVQKDAPTSIRIFATFRYNKISSLWLSIYFTASSAGISW